MHYAPASRSLFRAIALLGAGLVLGLTACSDPPPGKLFDEEGAWSLVRYNSGDGQVELPPARENAFLLSFDKKAKVVTTAACTSEESSNTSPDDSPCQLSPATTEWQCQCFAYAYQEDVMQWQEFPAGTAMPPKVKFDPDIEPTAGGGGDDTGGGTGTGDGGESGGAAGDITAIQLTEIPGSSGVYDFRPLPTGVFDGTNVSTYIFETRAASVFDQVYGDDEGRKAYCEPCVPGM